MPSGRSTLVDTLSFAELSGDHNPVHIDATYARRSLFGHTIKHGMHSLLTAIEQWASLQHESFRLIEIKASFREPIATGSSPKIEFMEKISGEVQFKVTEGATTLQSGRFSYTFSEAKNITQSASKNAGQPQQPQELNIRKLADTHGEIPVYLATPTLHKVFPHLSKKAQELQIAILCTCTRLIGMHCPGLNSIFSGIHLSFSPIDVPEHLKFAVTKTDTRFNLVEISVSNTSCSGKLNAFVRPKPRKQSSFSSLKKKINHPNKIDRTAIVVGGSRGLGEILAKFYAAYGGTVFITFSKGQEDAEHVQREVGKNCKSFYYNVLSPSTQKPPCLPTECQQLDLFFMASPKITKNTTNNWSDGLHSKYRSFYVTGLQHTVECIQGWWENPPRVNIFNPSSTFVNQAKPEFAEYAAAKLESESVCQTLVDQGNATSCFNPRLPKLKTDQTTAISDAFDEAQDPDDYINNLLLEFFQQKTV